MTFKIMSKKTLVLGASLKPERYSNIATKRLTKHGHEVALIGLREGQVEGIDIQKGTPEIEGVHTVTLYLNPKRQVPYYDYILSLQPKRIIFNPGTENPELVQLAQAQGIETEIACTLVMLATEVY